MAMALPYHLNPDEYVLVFCKYIMRKGKRIYPKKGTVFRFWIHKSKLRNS